MKLAERSARPISTGLWNRPSWGYWQGGELMSRSGDARTALRAR